MTVYHACAYPNYYYCSIAQTFYNEWYTPTSTSTCHISRQMAEAGTLGEECVNTSFSAIGSLSAIFKHTWISILKMQVHVKAARLESDRSTVKRDRTRINVRQRKQFRWVPHLQTCRPENHQVTRSPAVGETISCAGVARGLKKHPDVWNLRILLWDCKSLRKTRCYIRQCRGCRVCATPRMLSVASALS